MFRRHRRYPGRESEGQGKDVSEYVEGLIEKEIDKPKTLDEILAPFRREVKTSGITDDELDDLIENERQAIWEEKHGRPEA